MQLKFCEKDLYLSLFIFPILQIYIFCMILTYFYQIPADDIVIVRISLLNFNFQHPSICPQKYNESETGQILNAKNFVLKNGSLVNWGLKEACCKIFCGCVLRSVVRLCFRELMF